MSTKHTLTTEAELRPHEEMPSSFSLVEHFGDTSTDDGSVKVMRGVNGLSFELWHADGRKVFIPLLGLIENGVELFRAPKGTDE